MSTGALSMLDRVATYFLFSLIRLASGAHDRSGCDGVEFKYPNTRPVQHRLRPATLVWLMDGDVNVSTRCLKIINSAGDQGCHLCGLAVDGRVVVQWWPDRPAPGLDWFGLL
jgi:hypothetical protein